MANGYQALGAGKVFDNRFPDPASWNDYFPSQRKNKPDDPMPEVRPANGLPKMRLFDWGPVNVEDKEMGDAKVADWVIQQFELQHEKPFFLASGFYRLHLPWYVHPGPTSNTIRWNRFDYPKYRWMTWKIFPLLV